MNVRKSVILLLSLFMVLYFNPLVAGATEQGETELEELEEIQSETEKVEPSDNPSAAPTEEAENEVDNEEISDAINSVDATDEEQVTESEEGKAEPVQVEEETEVAEDEEPNETISILSTIEIRPGERGPHVAEFKRDLVRLGFVRWSNPSEVYGENTERVVRDFQEYYGLPATGIVDQATRDKMRTVLAPPYQNGDRGEPVVKLKRDLVELGLVRWSNPSIFYGKNTAEVVKKFQRLYRLKADGVADEATLAKLTEVMKDLKRYQPGVSGQHVADMKKDLVRLGFVRWSNPTPHYGTNTARVVEDFQKYYNLPVTGKADLATREKMSEVLNPPYRIGDRGEPVVALKQSLVELGFAKWSNPSQFYGTNTANAVKRFQKAYGLTEDGIAGSETLAKIEQLLHEGYKKGESGSHIESMKRDLVRLGFVRWSNPTPHYGENTAKVVADFQRYYNLPVTGDADRATLNKIKEVLEPPYKNGDRGEPVVSLKQTLVDLGFANWSDPTQFYGTNTANAVKRFQRAYGLNPSGKADVKTLAKMEEILKESYRRGDKGSHIVELKENLVVLGFARWSNPTPIYGKNTANAVKRFQKAYGLPETGVVDKRTLQTIENNIVKIFIDPGHGGNDSGASAFELLEKDVVLDIGLAVADELSKYAGAKVMLSRLNDSYPSLSERTDTANSWGADYFVSLHINASGGSGFETYIYNGSVSQETRNRQRDIHTHLANWLKKNSNVSDRGMKRANFHVLRESTMPAILIEYMFIDNRRENNLLKNKSYRKILGKVTAEAIAKSFNLKKK